MPVDRSADACPLDLGHLVDLDQLAESIAVRVADRLGQAGARSPWMNVREAAAYVGITVDRTYRLAAARQIPHRRLGRHLGFHRTELDKWMDGFRAGPNPDTLADWPTDTREDLFPTRFHDRGSPHETRASNRSYMGDMRRGGDAGDNA